MTVDDVLSIVDVRDVRVSPDGSRLLYVTRHADLSRDRYVHEVWLLDLNGPHVPRLLGEGRLPRWSFGGEFIWFSGSGKSWSVFVGGPRVRSFPLERGLRPVDASWSPAGGRFAVLCEVGVSSGPVVSYPPGNEGEKKRLLYVVDAGNGDVRKINTLGFVNGFSWSPDGRRIVYSFRPSFRDQDIFRSELAVVDVETGRSRVIVACPGHHTEPLWSPDGRFIAYLTRGCGGDWLQTMYVKVIGTGSRSGYAWCYRFPRGVHILRLVSWGPDGKHIIFLANIGVSRWIFRLGFPSGSLERLFSKPGVYGNVSLSKKGLLAFSYEGWRDPPEVCVYQLGKSGFSRVTHLNDRLRSLDLGGFDILRWKGKSGFDVEGVVGIPVSSRDGKHPLLLYLHGGPASSFLLRFSPGRYYYPVQVFLGMGFYVFMPNPPGSIGYGEDFRKAIKGRWGVDVEDVLVGLRNVVRNYAADRNSIGVMGWSYGGYLTLLAVERGGLFKVASEGGGIFDLVSFYGTTDVPDWLEAYFGCGPYGGCMALYLSASPVVHVDRIKVPVLILHGGGDRRVPLSQSLELYRAMRRLGLPVKLIVYKGQGHVITRPSLRRDCLNAGVRWFKRFLLRRKAR